MCQDMFSHNSELEESRKNKKMGESNNNTYFFTMLICIRNNRSSKKSFHRSECHSYTTQLNQTSSGYMNL